MDRGCCLTFWIKDVLEKSALVRLSPSTRVWYNSLAQEADCEDALSGLRATPILHVPVGALCLALGSLVAQHCTCAYSVCLTSLFLWLSPREITSLGFVPGRSPPAAFETESICTLLQPCPLCRDLEDGKNAN